MKKVQIVIDTNVLFAAFRSNRGASYRLISLLGRHRAFEVNISVPLIFEYESILVSDRDRSGLKRQDIDDVLDYICAVANHRKISYLWRPHLKDPKDDFILELAVEAGAKYIITYNKKDFKGIRKFDIKTLTPKEFLEIIGEMS